MQFGFGPWRPDVTGPGSGYLSVAEGVIPKFEASGFGYGPYPQIVAADGAEALADTPRGIISVQLPDGSWAVYVATDAVIAELQSDFTFDDIDTGRNVPDNEDVSFALIGTKLLNTDTVDGFRAYDIVSGGANSAVSGAPAARSVFVMKNVAFALGTSASPRSFANSDIGNHAKWTGGAANRGTLEDGGALVGGADLKNGFGVMFQESAIRGITFGNSVSAYRVDKVSDGLGCVAGRTIIPWDGRVFWWDTTGPYMMVAGSAPQPIGAGKLTDWAASSIGRQNYRNLQGAVDPQRYLAMWRIDDARVLVYHWLHQEWSVLPVSTTALARIATPSTSIDLLSGTIDALEGTIDSLGGSVAPEIGGLNLSRKYASFTGANMAATLELSVQRSPVSGLISWATPIDDAAAGTLQVGVSDRLDAAVAWKSGEAKVSNGRVPLRARGHNIAFRRNIPAGTDWTFANGVDEVAPAMGGLR
jgi:hypothetical protein